MPAPDGLRSFSVDSSLATPADAFTAELSGSEFYRTASPEALVTLPVGYKTVGGDDVTMALIEDGVVDLLDVRATPSEVVTQLQGRDQTTVLLDREVHKRYRRTPVSPAFTPPPGVTVPPPEMPEVVGVFRASTIARDVLAEAQTGLGLAWQCPDYTFREDFVASGRVWDVLTRLVEPWNQVPPLGVDLYVQGSTLLVRQRVVAPVPDQTFTVPAARLSLLSERKTPLPLYGVVVLRGSPSAGGDEDAIVVSREETRVQSSESYANNGLLVNRVVTRSIYRMPDEILLRQTVQTYTIRSGQLVLTNEKVTRNTWDSSLYDRAGPINQPKQRRSRTSVSELRRDVWQVTSTEDQDFSYGSDDFLESATTIKKKANRDGALVESEMTVRHLYRAQTLTITEVTEKYGWNSSKATWRLTQRDTQTSAGHPPGGPGRLPGITGAENGLAQIEVRQTLSADLDAIRFEYSNVNLTTAELRLILDQIQAVSGKTLHEVAFSGVGMPWLRRGSVVRFTDFTLETPGATVPLQPALVIEHHSEYDQSGESPHYTHRGRALFFGAA